MTTSFKTKISKLTSILAISGLIFSSTSFMTFAANTTIDFSGYTWTVKSGFNGPGPNNWDDSTSSVFLDSANQLHLKVSNIGGQWYSSEVYLPNSLGYGTYEWETPTHVDKIDTNLVLGLFLYQDDTHEIDIEYSQWAVPSEENVLNYTVQPYTTKSNLYTSPLTLQDGVSTHKIEWTKDYILFSTWQNGKELNAWQYTGANNFVPGGEKVDMNFWMIKGNAPSTGTDQEVVIKSFKFTPVSATPVVTPDPVTTPTPVVDPVIPTPTPVVDPIVTPTPVVTTPATTTSKPYVPNKNKGNSITSKKIKDTNVKTNQKLKDIFKKFAEKIKNFAKKK